MTDFELLVLVWLPWCALVVFPCCLVFGFLIAHLLLKYLEPDTKDEDE